MKKSFLLFIMFLIFVFSSITFFMILNYLDPYSNKILSLLLISFTFFISISTFLALIIYYIKKIHYRWRVELFHVRSSFRQWYLMALFIFWIFIFKIVNWPVILLWFLLFIMLSFFELFIQNLDY